MKDQEDTSHERKVHELLWKVGQMLDILQDPSFRPWDERLGLHRA